MIEDVDKFARELPRLTLHGNIPTGTTMALAARVVELLDRVAELEGRHHFAPMAVACGLDSGATLDELYERMREMVEIESELRAVSGKFGADEKPDDHEVVEVYDQTRCSGMRSGGWTGWPAHAVSDWHLWRPKYRTPDGVNERSAKIRTELGAIELEFNGFYMLPGECCGEE